MNWLIPILGAAIGAATNEIAVRLAFHWILPRKEAEIKAKSVELVLSLIPKPLQGICRKTVTNKIKNQNLADLQNQIIIDVKKEILFIDALGAVIGFIVGLIGGAL